MQPASRRVKTIYSVIASPNRLEILRILNTKGPLSYSELKTLAGFKSKKESGKFAYHLRKLVRQLLITLNRSERKYIVTNLGRLVLNLTRQIEEQSVIESGKLYVRTSRQTMEEFNADKILQSLVREAGMPVELAQKITSEAEARLYKFQTTYLTAPLIRELVNALLIEHGYEEYRHKLTRLGLPVYDISELVSRAGGAPESVESVLAQTAHRVFGEYLLLTQLPRDVTDAHLAGEIHISNTGSWGLVPDTVFIDLLTLHASGINLGGKLPATARVPAPAKLGDAAFSFATLASLLSREVATEVSFSNFLGFFHKFAAGAALEELRDAFSKTFALIASNSYQALGHPTFSISLAKPVGDDATYDDALLVRLARAALEAYREYAERAPVPRIRLTPTLNGFNAPDLVEPIVGVLEAGGSLGLAADGATRAFSGIRKVLSPQDAAAESVAVLHALSVNLPRLAHESNRDETYFRAKLALTLQLCATALKTRRKLLDDMMKKGLLPTLASEIGVGSAEYTPLVVNLVGLDEAVTTLVGDRSSQASRRTIVEKAVETAAKVFSDRAEKLEERGGVAIVRDEAATRFARIDTDKYGKGAGPATGSSYSDIPMLRLAEAKGDAIEDLGFLYRKLSGGFAVNLELDAGVKEAVTKAMPLASQGLEYFRFQSEVPFCKNCGAKVPPGAARCKACRSTAIARYTTA